MPNPGYSRSAAKAAAEASVAEMKAHAAAAAAGTAGGGEGDVEKATGKPAAAAGGGATGAAALPLAAREKLQLLGGITGFNEPGVLLALMGGSGAGERFRCTT